MPGAKAQPAKKSYFFSKGYIDLKNTIVGAWKRNFSALGDYVANIGMLTGEPWWKKIFFGILNILAMISVIVFGSLITGAITVLNIMVLLVFMAVIYIGFTVIWIVDRIYLMHNKIFTACHECKTQSLIPIYLCPNCRAEHTNLTPGVYGILKRTCNCGTKLPTTFFNGRKDLTSICPNPDCRVVLNSRESRPICIPIIGGRSVGKTAFITAFSKEFIENVAPAKSMETEFYSSQKADIYREIENDYRTGATRMTKHSRDPHETSSVSFSFFVKHPTFKPERLVHVYDIAGEVFTNNDESEVQKQYEYCQGMVLMIDPFSIPLIASRYEHQMSAKDKAGIGTADITGIMDSFMTKIRQVTGMTDKEMSKTPLAIVIGKIDTADLDEIVGDKAVKKQMSDDPLRFKDYYDTQDYLCRKFFSDNSMDGFLNLIGHTFRNHRFFACSAIGHTKEEGAYTPQGVLAPMEWLFQNADPAMAAVWNDNQFSKTPMKFERT